MTDHSRTDDSGAEARSPLALDRAIRRARLALSVERIWPAVVPALSVVGLFLVLSWAGLWRLLPDAGRFGVLALFAVALIAALIVGLWRVRLPDDDEGVARVERASRLDHRPATALRDRLSPVAADAGARALWTAHRRRALQRLADLRAGAPRTEMARRDRFALRFAVPVLLAVTVMMAGGEWQARIAEAFAAPRPVVRPVVTARIDGWIDPPAYTQLPPIMLAGATGEVAVPTGSVATLRIVSPDPLGVTVGGDAAPATLQPEADATGVPTATTAASPPVAAAATDSDGGRIRVYKATLATDGRISVADGAASSTWRYRVTPDRPPTLSGGAVAATRSGAFTLTYDVADDYGIAEGSVTFRPKRLADGMRPLVEVPTAPLRTGRLKDGKGKSQANVRLDEHPFAGLDVVAAATVKDAAGQEARFAPPDGMAMPARAFRNKIARALVEQRRELALDANARDRVVDALDAMTFAPDVFIKDAGIYLGLKVIETRATAARTDDDLRGVLDDLWAMAREIEDGQLSDAQKRVAEARERLQDAIDRNASEEEISRLTEELKQAMAEMMRQMAEEMAKRQGEMAEMPFDPNAQMITPDDLQKMLDRIEELAKQGNKEAAQALLEQLQQMLDGMQMAQGQMQQPEGGEMSELMKQMDKLGELMREQQRLMDETFDMNQGRRPQGRSPDGRPQPRDQRPMTEQEMAQLMEQLKERQAELERQIEEMKKGNKPGQGQEGQPGEGQDGQGQGNEPQFGQGEGGEGQGMGPGGRALDRAGRAMGEAGDALGQQSPGQAFGHQGEAMQALREGMESMMQQMQQMLAQQGQGQGPGNQQQATGAPRGKTDPLGRPQRTEGPELGLDVKVPDEIDTERVRRIMNAIRGRLGERFRPQMELDYLERLLTRP